MNNILIIGKNSFIGKSLSLFLGESCCVSSRNEVDLLNLEKSLDFISKNNFNIVINCAICGTGKNADNLTDFYNNILLFENLLFIQNKLKFKLITFSSGAEFNRGNKAINNKEGQYNSVPTDFYGLAKYNHSKRVENNKDILNLRIFNVFGPLERQNRFIFSCFSNAIQNKDIQIYEDKLFDFFSIYDLSILIKYCINNNISGEFNCVYNNKKLLSETANEIINITNSKSIVNIKEISNNHYIGDSYKINQLKLPFWGLRRSLELYANQLT